MQVGRYNFVDRLAVGGMAEVFVAIAHGSEGFEKPVVIKRLLPQLAAMPRFLQMFLDEARIMASLQHGNVVQILDVGKMDGVPFLALEYVDGKDLMTILQRAEQTKTTIPHGLMAYVAAEICRGLDYAHRKTDEEGHALHIVHRDVNPANIFISYEGAVKVGDFGLAKARDNLEVSEVGLIKGKFSYMSPEQAEGAEIDHRSDIFSLGTTLYEATCGQKPFVGSNEIELLGKVRAGEFPEPSAIVSGYPVALEAIVLRALRHDPEQRYADASELRDELLRYMQLLPSRMDDRALTTFLDALYQRHQRRSASALVKLAPTGALPPAMTSITKGGGVSEFQPTNTPTPAAVVTRAPPSAAPIASGATQGPVDGMPTAASARRRTGPTLLLLLVAGCLVGGGYLLYPRLVPPLASLAIDSRPAGAKVLVDGDYSGQRTPAVLTGITVGKEFVVTLQLEGAAEAQRRFRLRTSRRHSHTFELQPLLEELALDSEPSGADVRLGDELRGQTPMTLRLQRGQKHAISFEKTAFESKTIHHQADQARALLKIRLEPTTPPQAPPRRRAIPARVTKAAGNGADADRPTGSIEIASEQPANVYIDGRLLGRTPGFHKALPAGSYRIKVVPDGANITHTATITVVADRTHRLTLTPPQ